MRMHYYLNRRLRSAEGYMRSSFFHVPRTLMQAIVSKSRETYETIQRDTAVVNGEAIGNWPAI